MKTPTIEELAEIFVNKLHRLEPHLPPWGLRNNHTRELMRDCMQAVITALYASVSGFPSVEELLAGLTDRPDINLRVDVAEVRNLMLTAHLAERQQREAKLEAVRALPDKWKGYARDNLHHMVAARCARELESALSAAPVEPVPAIDGDVDHHDEHAWAQEPEDPHAHLKAAWEAGKRIRYTPPGGKAGDWYCKTTAPYGAFTWDQLVECYEIEPDQPKGITHNGVDYIPHKPGDPCPVDGETTVEVLIAHTSTGQASAMEWHWGKGSTEVLGYRVIIPAVAEAPAEKWAKEKAAFAEGKRIQYRNPTKRINDVWQEEGGEGCPPCWDVEGGEFRIAPGQEAPAQEAPVTDPFCLAIRQRDEAEARAEAAEARVKSLEAIIEKSIETVNRDGTTTESLPAAINAKIMERDVYHHQTIAKLDDANAEIARLKEQFATEQRMRSDAMAELRELMRKNGTLADRSHELERMIPEFQSQLTQEWQKNGALESHIAALTPRPVSVKPTEEDADSSNQVVLFDGTEHDFTMGNWQAQWPSTITHWLPGNLSRLMPDVQESPEEKERREFEARFPGLPSTKSETGIYTNHTVHKMWEAWLARAGKEAAP